MKCLNWIVVFFGIGAATSPAQQTLPSYPPPAPPAYPSATFVYAPYNLDQPLVQGYLNEFWNNYGMAAGPYEKTGAVTEISNIACCFEWDSMKACWQNENTTSNPTPYSQMMTTLSAGPIGGGSTVVDGIQQNGMEPEGYLWQASGQEMWFQGNPGHAFHFDQEPGYICAVYNEYMWSGNDAFLTKALPMLQAIMTFMLNNAGTGGENSPEGLFLTPTTNGYTGNSNPPPLDNTGLPNDGSIPESGPPTTGGAPSTYMDGVESGYADAWIDADYYTALQDMVELEDAAVAAGIQTADPSLGDECTAALQNYKANYENTFWVSQSGIGRFAGWMDVSGQQHDSGYTYVNLEALARGLGTPEEAYEILTQWLDNPNSAEAILFNPNPGNDPGAHYGSTDPYDLVVAPRTETTRVPNTDWDLWSIPDRNNTDPIPPDREYGYGAEDGGGLVWVNYYDVMARLRYLDADNAYTKLTTLLWRCANDPAGDFLSCGRNSNGNAVRPANGYGEELNQLQIDGSETGICALSMLNGFMGVQAHLNGLNITPQLPGRMFSAANNDVYYLGGSTPIAESRGTVISSQEYNAVGDNTTYTLSSASDTMEQRFTPPGGPFNTVAVFVNMNVPSGVSTDVTLNSVTGGVETPIASERATIQENPSWVYFAFPSQSASGTQQYSIQLTNVANGMLTWYQNSGGTLGPCYHNGGSTLTGSYDARIDEESLNSSNNFVDYSLSNSPDLLNSTTNTTEQETLAAQAPFCRLAVRVGTSGTTTSQCKLTLQRLMGVAGNGTNNWQTVAAQQFDNVVQSMANQGWITLKLADQPAGTYLITLSYVSGKISWFRNSTGTSTVLTAATNGTATSQTSVPGVRDVWTQGQIYNISIGSPPTVTTTVNAGSSYIYNP